jgi:lipoprotein-releasing system permease protein
VQSAGFVLQLTLMNITRLTTAIVQRYLASRRGFTRVVTGFSVLGIALGVAALLIVLAVMSGFRQELMTRILGVSGHITVQIAGLTTRPAESLAFVLAKQPGIERAVPYVSGQVMVTANGKSAGAYVRGVAGPQALGFIDTKMRIGEVAAISQPNTVLMGENMASALGLMLGSGATLIAADGARTPFGFVPRMAQGSVGGIFKIGMVQFDSGLVLAPLSDVQRLLKRGDEVDALELHIKNPSQVNDIIGNIFPIIEGYAPNPADIAITTWQESNADFFRALQIERLTMFIILSLIILVAAFNIITGQMMLVNDKMADIAILRTMGTTQGTIMRIFLLNGLLLGGFGTISGFGLGLLVVFNMRELVNFLQNTFGLQLFASDVYFLSELPSKLAVADVMGVLVLALTLTVLASLYPAWRASRFSPVELLRRG